jgi:hypothetical protein
MYLSHHVLPAQSQERIYSLMLLNFAKTINWPSPGENKFVIGILEYPPLVTELKAACQNSANSGRTFEIREVTDPQRASGCHILFLPAYKAKALPLIIEQIPTAPTLIVSNKADVARKGGGISFILINGKLSYEINVKAIEKRGMKVSSALKSSATIVQ